LSPRLATRVPSQSCPRASRCRPPVKYSVAWLRPPGASNAPKLWPRSSLSKIPPSRRNVCHVRPSCRRPAQQLATHHQAIWTLICPKPTNHRRSCPACPRSRPAPPSSIFEFCSDLWCSRVLPSCPHLPINALYLWSRLPARRSSQITLGQFTPKKKNSKFSIYFVAAFSLFYVLYATFPSIPSIPAAPDPASGRQRQEPLATWWSRARGKAVQLGLGR
jgi:hypothetical protein